MDKSRIILLLGILLLGLPGCVSMPVSAGKLSPEIEAGGLARDVNFLAQPALNGRKPGTWESGVVRQYIESRFRQCGLVPWPDTNSFEQSFGPGINVIGVLPGSDPNLADQFVILCAHYDHLGDKHLGACDNASGVATLLEIAGKIALSPQRPRRPIAFAAFDCEEQFAMGSFAFTCSEHFDQKKIAAVVNVDMFGRDFLGVIPKAVFLVGTESYPALREHIVSESGNDGIKILPIGTALVGPTGDHIPFEPMDIPVVFFSCGYFPDYHKPTDTPEKLNYEDIKHSADIVADTVGYLADGDLIEKPRAAAPVQKYELETLDYILKTANANQDRLKSSPKQAEMLKKLTQQASQFPVRDNFSRNECLGLMTDMITPALELAGPDFKWDPNTLTCVRAMYASHRIFLIEHLRDFFRVGLKNKPSIFGKTKYEYEGYDLTDDLISFTQTPDGGYALYALLPKIGFTFEIAGLPFPHSSFGLSYSPEPLHCIGQREQITDYCLLIWRRDINDQSLSGACQKLLSVVTATDANLTYAQWLQWRLAEGPWADEQEWVSALVKSDNSSLAAQANRVEMQIAVQNGRFGKLLPLVDNLSDEKPCPKQYTCEKFQENAGPFAEHPCFLHTCRDANNSFKNLPCPTPADSALERLRTLTGQKFGKDKSTWRKWIETHTREPVVSSARKDDLKS